METTAKEITSVTFYNLVVGTLSDTAVGRVGCLKTVCFAIVSETSPVLDMFFRSGGVN